MAYEPFDYPVGVALLDQTNGIGFAGPWRAGGFNARAHDRATMRPGALSFPGLAVTGANHLQIDPPDGDAIAGLIRVLSVDLNQPGTTYYLSFLHRPEAEAEYSAVVLGSGEEPELSVGKSGSVRQYHVSQRGGRGRVYSGVEPVVGQTAFLVVKLEFRDGPDRFTLYVNPVPGSGEPSRGAVKEDLDLRFADGLTLYSRGAWSVDEIRIGTTWADVAPAETPRLETVTENWPGFRGPTGQGISSERNVPRHWSATSNIAWRVEVPSDGWSSPVVWDRRVFLTGTTAGGAACHVLCFDRDTGAIRWDRHVFDQMPAHKEDRNSHATPTPVTDGRTVYAVFGSGSVAAVDVDGTLRWTNHEVAFYSRHGLGASPILDGQLVIMPYDGSKRVPAAGQYPNNSEDEKVGWRTPWDQAEIVALDRQTGRRVWTGRRGSSRIAHATPVVYRENNVDRLLSIAGDAVQGFDLNTGERLWTVYCQGEGLVPSPVISGNLVVAASGFEKTTLRGVRLGGRGDVTPTHIAWEQKKGVPTQSSLLSVEPFAYGITDGGIATCLRAATGEIVWQERVGGNHCASPVYADGDIYFLSEAGETTIIRAGPKFEVVARNSVGAGERCQASLAVSHGRLFQRTERHLWCIGR